jgi:predicted Holliday junction resolvase-like endonuclease
MYFYTRKLKKYADEKTQQYNKLISQKKSSEIRLGQISEHLIPFTKNFPFDPKKARFIGSPIDMIVFEENKIVFVEVKTGDSKLSNLQKNIRKIVEDKNIEWFELRID